MGIGERGIALQQLQTLFSMGTTGGLTDAQLLERFASRRDETAELAFRALVEPRADGAPSMPCRAP